MGVALRDENGEFCEGEPVTPKRLTQNQLDALAKGRANAIRKPRTSLDARAWLRRLVDDYQYRKNFRRRMINGELAPGLEAMVYHYALGRPKETHEIIANISNTTIALEKLNDAQLQLLRDMLQGTAVLRQIEGPGDIELLDADHHAA